MNATTRTLLALVLVFAVSSTAAAQGIFLPSAGPVHRGMGGASTAVPLDAIGAFYWNPATISALPSSELSVGMELLLSDLDTRSTIGGASGNTDSDAGASFLPSVGWVAKKDDSNITMGMGVFAKAGFKTNYPGGVGSPNPIFNPAVSGLSLGHLHTKAEFIEIAPAMSIALSDNFAIGGGPTINMGWLEIDPFIFDANADGSWPSGTGTRVHWGGGAQLGFYYRHSSTTTFGGSIKSPQWFETFTYQTQDETGAPRTTRFDLDLPMIVSLGMGYYGFENLIFAFDVRYFDYKNADGFGRQGLGAGPGGNAPSFLGLGWSSIVAAAMGVQYQCSDVLALRGGYSYHQNVMQDNDVLVAIGAPLFQQHMLSGGASYVLGEFVTMNMGYTYVGENDVTGPIVTPGGAGTASSYGNAHMLSMGLSARY